MEPVPQPSPLPPPEIILWGDPTTLAVEVVVTLLADLFGSQFGGVNSATQTALNQLRKDLGDAIDTVKRFAWKIGRGEGYLYTAIGQVLLSLNPDTINAVRKVARTIKEVYDKVIVPALDVLQKIRSRLNDIYNNWIRPILVILMRIRQVLAILKALHVPFAAKLDARLGKIENMILGPWIWIVQQVNGLGGWLNIILTVRGTIQRVVMMRTLKENMGSLTALWWDTQTSDASKADTTSLAPAVTISTPAQAQANFQAYAQLGIGPIADRAARAQLIATTEYPAI